MMSHRLASLLWIGTAGCTSSAPRPEEPEPAPVFAPEPTVVAATAVSLGYGKPPLKSHGFDVVLRNPSMEPRWLILPTTFPYAGREDPAPGGEEVELQIFKVSEAPRVIVVEGIGGDFWAVRLPGAGTLRLSHLNISSWWDKVPEMVVLRVIVAKEIRLGGRGIAEVVGMSFDSESGADVAAPGGAGDERALKFWHPEGPGIAVTFDEESRSAVKVPLALARP